MKRFFPAMLLLVAALAGCGQGGPAGADATVGAPIPAAAREPVETLSGHWRVAGIDGVALDEPVGLALTGDEARLWWEPRCAGAVRAYRIDGSRIWFASPQGPRPAGAPTPPVCAIGLPPRLADVMRALDAATSITRTESNGVLIAGPRHSVTLYSQ